MPLGELNDRQLDNEGMGDPWATPIPLLLRVPMKDELRPRHAVLDDVSAIAGQKGFNTISTMMAATAASSPLCAQAVRRS